jgi:hypothetical protein
MEVSGQRHAPAALYPGKGLVWIQRLEEKSFASAGDRIPVVQSVVRHYTELPQLLGKR